ncbi:PREDICTED: transient-receptor-potential-like protein [Branchiostoma belcheri]|uniref:Transient-receptor-potential-like protein n=1 Tax=Branchiostoma belcheri TaxID=7741 RepID=A0A6P4ZAM2_BRABE|nr:PREDICTED: transient-receptor-potential-like protein [Branchiostoma belcheri]
MARKMERAFWSAVRNNAVEELATLISDIDFNPGVSIDVTCLRDEFRRTAVEVGVDSGSLEAAELLLDRGVPAGRALLYAVDRENIEAVELLLDRETSGVEELCGSLEMETGAFQSDMTPVKMAATRNNYDILKLLLDRGFPVPSPDIYNEWTTVETTRAWFTAYQAVSSPSLILLTSPDPFRTCFQRARALRDACWKRENYRIQLEELADQCETFACELLDEVRDSDELDTVFEFNHGEATDKDLRGTLETAVEMKQKKAGRVMKIPMIRGTCWFFSVMDLLFILIVEAQMYRVSSEELDNMVQNIPTSGLRLNWTQSFIFIWMSGFFVEQINAVWYQGGLSQYFKTFWNLLDFMAVSLYATYITLRFWAVVQWETYYDHDISLDWEARARWNSFQPVMVADALFAIFTMVVFLRAMYFLRMSRYLGSLQISFGRMVMDIIKFVIFLGLVDIAFACGFNHLYWFYGSVHNYLCEKYQQSNLMNVGCSKAHGYGTLSNTILSLFWAEFGMADLSMLELKPTKSPVEALQIHEQPVFTEVVGTAMFALYQVVAVLVLLNLLIAIMSTSYQVTEDNKDQEWAFCFVSDTLSVKRGNMSLPPPFNLLMLLKTGLIWLFQSSPCGVTEFKLSRPGGQQKYQAVIDKLAKRYRLRKERENTD